MELPKAIYRITKPKWAGHLNGSGYAARWNPNGIFMCYAAESKALACLEMLVHLQSEQLNHSFKVTKINIPSQISCLEIDENELKENWKDFFEIHLTQEIGKNWIQSHSSCLLRVPSSLIEDSFNYLINPAHTDFKLLNSNEIQHFMFDNRLVKLP